jgi:ketosteroid isomerase-like protein
VSADDDDSLRDIALRWGEALNARDLATLIDLATEDVECDVLQISAGGRYDGHDGIRRWMREVTTHDPGHQVELQDTRVIGDGRVAVFGQLDMKGRKVSPYTMVTVIRGGKIAAMRSYLSDEATLRELGLLD